MVNLKPFFTCSSHALMPLPYGSTHPCALDPHVFLDKMLRIHGLQYVPSYKVIQMDPFFIQMVSFLLGLYGRIVMLTFLNIDMVIIMRLLKLALSHLNDSTMAMAEESLHIDITLPTQAEWSPPATLFLKLEFGLNNGSGKELLGTYC